MEQRAPKLGAVVLHDADALGPAVDEFLFEVYKAGKIPMPRDVARWFRMVRCLAKRAVNRPGRYNAVDARGFPMWFVWIREFDEINRQYPPPGLPQEIRDRMTARALRAMGVGAETMSAGQEADERRRIAQAHDAWPPV